MGAGVGTNGRRRGVASLLAVALLAPVAGCGDDDGPSAAERRAAHARWVERADTICRDVEQDIVARGAPIDVLDVDRVAVRASQDVRAAADEIRSLRTPPGVSRRVRPFVDELGRLEEHLGLLTRASADADMDALADTARALRGDAGRLHDRAGAAGLRDCGRSEMAVVVYDAIVAPVFANHADRFNRWFHTSLRRLSRPLPDTPRETADYYARVEVLVRRARERWTGLLMPERVREAARAYDQVLDDVERLSGAIADEVDGGRRYSLKRAREIEREYIRLDRRERRAMRRVMKVTGARPLAVPQKKAPAPESEEST
jgi:hypothetical protein